jgi:hypothetical protein
MNSVNPPVGAGGGISNTPCPQLKSTIDNLRSTIAWYNHRLADPSLISSQRTDILAGLAVAQSELATAQYDYQVRCVGPIEVPGKPSIQILMVICDDDTRPASYGDDPSDDQYFGLSFLVSTLTQYQPIHLQVTRKHRRTDPANTLPSTDENFTFSDASLTGFDQLWLLCFCVSDPFTAAEANAVARFMNGGRGVFATGDHSNLGAPIGSQIYRVRKMRKWTFADGVPGSGGASDLPHTPRLDTTVRRPGETETHFHDQSDDIPQSIVPLTDMSNQPHPLLLTTYQGAGYIIEVLPDHMHEGEIVDPATIDLSATYTLDGKTLSEFPASLSDGALSRPVVVASSQSHPNPIVSDEAVHVGSTDNAANRMFYSIGAYDGHPSGVGRIVVDSTFHHFVNINLIGDKAAVAAPDAVYQGFRFSPQSQQVLELIQAYFINIALWLTPRTTHVNIHNHWLRWLSLSVNLRELLSDHSVASDAASRMVGIYASQRFNRLTGRPWFVEEIMSAGEPEPHGRAHPGESFGRKLAAVVTRDLLAARSKHTPA